MPTTPRRTNFFSGIPNGFWAASGVVFLYFLFSLAFSRVPELSSHQLYLPGSKLAASCPSVVSSSTSSVASLSTNATVVPAAVSPATSSPSSSPTGVSGGTSTVVNGPCDPADGSWNAQDQWVPDNNCAYETSAELATKVMSLYDEVWFFGDSQTFYLRTHFNIVLGARLQQFSRGGCDCGDAWAACRTASCPGTMLHGIPQSALSRGNCYFPKTWELCHHPPPAPGCTHCQGCISDRSCLGTRPPEQGGPLRTTYVAVEFGNDCMIHSPDNGFNTTQQAMALYITRAAQEKGKRVLIVFNFGVHSAGWQTGQEYGEDLKHYIKMLRSVPDTITEVTAADGSKKTVSSPPTLIFWVSTHLGEDKDKVKGWNTNNEGLRGIYGFNEAARRVCKELNVPYVDLAKLSTVKSGGHLQQSDRVHFKHAHDHAEVGFYSAGAKIVLRKLVDINQAAGRI